MEKRAQDKENWALRVCILNFSINSINSSDQNLLHQVITKPRLKRGENVQQAEN